MYRRKPQGWLKHIDFFLLDLLSLCLAFSAACTVRFGLQWFDTYGSNPRQTFWKRLIRTIRG